MNKPKINTKQYLALAVLLVATVAARWHLTSLGEGDIFQTAEDVLAVILFF